MRLKQTPTILPALGWPDVMALPADKAPDAAWRLTLVRDERPASTGLDLPALKEIPLGTGDLTAAAVDVFAAIVSRHNLAAARSEDHTRQLVFSPNIGLVSVERDDDRQGEYVATHTLLSRRESQGSGRSEAAENTVHAVSLAPTPDAVAPTLRARAT